jgi:hypothetical protein
MDSQTTLETILMNWFHCKKEFLDLFLLPKIILLHFHLNRDENILKFKIYGLHALSAKSPSNVAHKRVKMLFNNSINVFRFVRGDVDGRIIAHFKMF